MQWGVEGEHIAGEVQGRQHSVCGRGGRGGGVHDAETCVLCGLGGLWAAWIWPPAIGKLDSPVLITDTGSDIHGLPLKEKKGQKCTVFSYTHLSKAMFFLSGFH